MDDNVEIINAKSSDYEKISILADNNGLLLEELDQKKFITTLLWLDLKNKIENKIENKIQLIAIKNKKVVGNYGGIPTNLKLHNKNVYAVLASNLVIDKQYRVNSLFFRIQKRFIESYRELNYQFAYGIINREGVLNLHLRMGWKELGKLHVFVKPISLHQIFKKKYGYNLFSYLLKIPLLLLQKSIDIYYEKKNYCIEIKEANNFNKDIFPLINDWIANKKICSVRSPEILNWRYSKLTGRNYKIYISYKNLMPNGFIVARTMKIKELTCTMIVDIVVKDNNKEVLYSLLNKCKDLSKNSNADVMAYAATVHDDILNLIKRFGFIKSPEYFTIVGHFNNNSNFIIRKFDFSDFHINWFDHDYV